MQLLEEGRAVEVVAEDEEDAQKSCTCGCACGNGGDAVHANNFDQTSAVTAVT